MKTLDCQIKASAEYRKRSQDSGIIATQVRVPKDLRDEIHDIAQKMREGKYKR